MKKTIFCLFALFLSVAVIAQNSSARSYEKWMARSHKKQRAGFVFLGVGAGLTAGGIALIAEGNKRNQNVSGYGSDGIDGDILKFAGGFTSVVGVGLMCGSIPFFIGAGRAKAKAMSFSFKAERAPVLAKYSFSSQYFPAVSLSIPIGK